MIYRRLSARVSAEKRTFNLNRFQSQAFLSAESTTWNFNPQVAYYTLDKGRPRTVSNQGSSENPFRSAPRVAGLVDQMALFRKLLIRRRIRGCPLFAASAIQSRNHTCGFGF